MRRYRFRVFRVGAAQFNFGVADRRRRQRIGVGVRWSWSRMEMQTRRSQQSHIRLSGLIVRDLRRVFLQRRRRLTQSIAIGTTTTTTTTPAAAVVVDNCVVDGVEVMMVPGRRWIVGRGDDWRLATAMFFVPLCMVLVVLHHYVCCSCCCRQIDLTHFHRLLSRLLKSENAIRLQRRFVGRKKRGNTRIGRVGPHIDIFFSWGGGGSFIRQGPKA